MKDELDKLEEGYFRLYRSVQDKHEIMHFCKKVPWYMSGGRWHEFKDCKCPFCQRSVESSLFYFALLKNEVLVYKYDQVCHEDKN